MEEFTRSITPSITLQNLFISHFRMPKVSLSPSSGHLPSAASLGCETLPSASRKSTGYFSSSKIISALLQAPGHDNQRQGAQLAPSLGMADHRVPGPLPRSTWHPTEEDSSNEHECSTGWPQWRGVHFWAHAVIIPYQPSRSSK